MKQIITLILLFIGLQSYAQYTPMVGQFRSKTEGGEKKVQFRFSSNGDTIGIATPYLVSDSLKNYAKIQDGVITSPTVSTLGDSLIVGNGVVRINGENINFTGKTFADIPPSSANLIRIFIVYSNTSGVLDSISGVQSNNPVAPDLLPNTQSVITVYVSDAGLGVPQVDLSGYGKLSGGNTWGGNQIITNDLLINEHLRDKEGEAVIFFGKKDTTIFGSSDASSEKVLRFVSGEEVSADIRATGVFDFKQIPTVNDVPIGVGSSYTFTSPLVNSSGVVSINTANTSTTGALTSTDWNTFNGKQDADYASLGTIITEDFSAALTNFTTTGAPGASIVSGQLQLSSAVGSVTLTNYISHNYGVSNLEDVSIKADVTVPAITSTSFGPAFGWQGGNGIQVRVAMETANAGKIIFYGGNLTTGSQSSASVLPITAGDILSVNILYQKSKIIAFVKNNTTGVSISSVLYISMGSPVAKFYAPSGRFGIYSTGGTYLIDNFSVTSNDAKNADWLFIFDSIGKGYFAGSLTNRWLSKIESQYQGLFTGNGASGNKIEDTNIAEVLALTSKKIVIDLGTNNLSNGQNVTTFMTNLGTMVTSLQSAGYVLGSTLFINTLLPRTTFDVTAYNDAILSAYPTATLNQTIAFKASTGTAMNTAFTTDGVHPNTAGHQLKADVIATNLGLKSKPNYGPLSNAVIIDPATSNVGIGKVPPVPEYTLDVQNNGANETVFRAGKSGATVSIMTIGVNGTYVGYGATFDNGQWTARSQRPIMMGKSATNGEMSIFANNATENTTFSPTLRGSMGVDGLSFNTISFGANGATGGNLFSNNGGSAAIILGGSAKTGSYVATGNGATAFQNVDGVYSMFINTGLTPGSGYTPTERERATTTGHYFGGGVTPTARIHVAGGTTTVSPFKFTLSGSSLLATPEAGSLEAGNADNKLYYTGASGTRNTIAYTSDSATKLTAYTVATLPTGTIGDIAYVTDATAPTYLGTLTGGGSIVCPVFFNGVAWVSH